MDLIACGKCGQTHELGDCPPHYCIMCGTVHLHNKSFRYANCEKNERYQRKIAINETWIKKNTAAIWAQPDREQEEEEED